MANIQQVMKDTRLFGDWVRFILAGGFNTFLTLGVYQLLIFVMPRDFAYAVSWLVGIVYLLIVYPTKVFPGGRSSALLSAMVVIIYLVVFVVGLWCLGYLVGTAGVHERLAIFVTLSLSASINFVLMRLVYRS
jgi:putative flippase GtrA